MTFSSPFGAPFQAPMATPGGVTPWYLSGGIALANCVAAYKAKGAASYAASKVNLAHPGTNDAADGAAYPTFNAATGWTFNGTTQYLTTGIVPNGGAYSIVVQFANPTYVAGNNCIIGANGGGASNTCAIRYRQGAVMYYINGGYIDSTVLNGGNLAVAGQAGYKNGVADKVMSAWSGTLTAALTIGAEHIQVGDTIAQFFKGDVIAVAIYSVTITAPQVLAVATATAAF